VAFGTPNLLTLLAQIIEAELAEVA